MLTNLSDVLVRRVAQHGDTAALTFADRSWTASELDAAISQVASSLLGLGLSAQDRVLVVLANSAQVPICYGGIWRAGGVAVPLLHQLTASEIAARAKHSEATLAITTADLLPRLLEAKQHAPGLQTIVVVGSDLDHRRLPGDCVAVDQVEREAGSVSDSSNRRRIDDLAVILYTGGTTGDPKGVMLSHVGLEACWSNHPHRPPDKTAVVCVPLAHVAGILWLYTHLAAGHHVVLLPSFDVRQVLSNIERHGANYMTGAPSMYVAMLSSPEAKRFDTRSVEVWTYGSAPMPPSAIEAFERTFGGTLHSAYGLTESSGGVFYTEAADIRKTASTGRVPAHADVAVRVVDEHGYDVASGEPGELWFKGPVVSPGYWRDSEATADAITDGWLKTGDLGRIDQYGDLFLLGRRKEIVISGGFNVYPAEIEEVICRLPGVAACAATGVPHRLLGEQCVAFVVLSDAAITEAAIAAHCDSHLAGYKKPVIRLVSEIPVNKVGKPDKRRLVGNLNQPSDASRPVAAMHSSSDAATSAPRWTRRLIAEPVRATVARLLQVEPRAVATDQPLMEQGLTSLLAVELTETISREFGRKVSATLAFDYPTIDAIADHLAGTVLGLDVEPTPVITSGHLPVASEEPIAIIGIGCRLPGGASGPDEMWSLLERGVDATSEVPPDRWNPDDYDDPACRRGGFVPDLDKFDAEFFGMSPAEAEALDPQQRMLLEVTWETLEHAGIAPDRLQGSATGVFLGMSFSEYLYMANFRRSIGSFGGGTGGYQCIAAGRIAHQLGLMGPTFVLDTACSSSLVATHQACQSLRVRECNMAIAGGVSAMLTPKFQLALAAAGALAPDGRCKTFDAGGNGYGRAEGCGLVLLKRLSDAQADGDTIYALILGSAVNHDGRASSLTAPRGSSQRALIETALQRAAVAPHEIGYVEAHGTGTPLGDPIEVGALKATLGRDRPADFPLCLGSVKANLGHLEPAAGITGLLKAALVLHHKQIPPQINLNTINPRLPLADIPAVIHTERAPFVPSPSGKRLAGVSSFGFSGTNVHFVLGEAPAPIDSIRVHALDNRSEQLLCVSGSSEAALRRAAGNLAHHLSTHPSQPLTDVCYTSAVGRAHQRHRAVVRTGSIAEAGQALRSLADTGTHPRAVVGQATRDGARVAFMFTGQGSQYANMGRRLYTEEPVFRSVIDRCNDILLGTMERSLIDAMFDDDGSDDLDQTANTQPALFALGYALAELWRSWGVEPSVVMGHSLGEYIAACYAGAFALEDGLQLVATRGRLMQALPPTGAMAAIHASEDVVLEALYPFFGRAAISAINGPANTVISGEIDAIERVVGNFTEDGVKASRLRVSHAFHSHLMEPILAPLRDQVNRLNMASLRLPLASNVTGQMVQAGTRLGADYWSRHTREAVQFARALESIVGDGVDTFIEIGPHPVLTAMGRAHVPDPQIRWLASLERTRDDVHRILAAVAELHAIGGEIDWRGFYRNFPARRTTLPTYPFQRKRYWLREVNELEGGAVSARPRAGEATMQLHGARLSSPLRQAAFSSRQGGRNLGVFRHHRVLGQVVFPATGYLEMVCQAAHEMWQPQTFTVKTVSFDRALALSETDETEVQLVISPPDGAGDATFEIHSLAIGTDDNWRMHAAGQVASSARIHPSPQPMPPSAIASRLEEVSVESYYQMRADGGMDWGPSFRCIQQLWRGQPGSGESLARLRLPDSVVDDHSIAHPALLDACLQPVGVAMATLDYGDEPYLPVGLEDLTVRTQLGREVWAHITLHPGSHRDRVSANVAVLDDSGIALATMTNLAAQRVSRRALARSAGLMPIADSIYRVRWKAKAREPAPAPTGRWLIVCGDIDRAQLLADRIAACRHKAVIVDVERLAEALTTPADGVVYWPIPGPGDAAETLGSFVAGAHGAAQSLLTSPQVCPMFVVTEGAVAASDGDLVDPAATAVWGFARACAIENPELGCRRIDISPSPLVYSQLADELLSGESEPEVALRGHDRMVARLGPARGSRDGHAPPVRSDSAYLVTGGLGALGIHVTRWLLERGAGRIYLAARRTGTEQARAVADSLDSERVMLIALDVSNRDAVAEVWNRLQGDPMPVRGIVHAAGVLDDGVVARQPWDAYQRVLAGKAYGALNLDEVVGGAELDFTVLFSSASALFGEGGQAAYAAANAFLDGLAWQRTARGRPTISVNWGAWAESGMAVQTQKATGRSVVQRGIVPLSTEDGLDALDLLVGAEQAQLAVLPWDWDAFARQYAPSNYLLADMILAHPTSRPSTDINPLDRLRQAENGDRHTIIEELIGSRLRQILGLNPDTVLAPDLPLSDLGMDSLIAVEFRNQLGQELGKTLPATLVYDYPTQADLVDFVDGVLRD